MQTIDSDGRTPLHNACTQDDTEFVSWLFKCILDKTDTDFYDEIVQALNSSLKRTSSLPRLPSTQSKDVLVGPGRQMNPLSSIQPSSFCLPRRSLKRMESVDGEELESTLEDSLQSSSEDGFLFSIGRRSHSFTSTSSHSTAQDSREASCESEQIAVDEDDSDFHESSPLSVSDVIDLRFFRISMKGESILHIMAREGFTDLLAIVLKVAKFIEHNISLDVLTHCTNGFDMPTPIEEAISGQAPECLKLLLHFAATTGKIDSLLTNDKLLKNAVFTGNVEVVKVLIEFGFHEGLGPAISLAFLNDYVDILRLLLYFHTQVLNVTEFSRVRRNGSITLDAGGMKFEGVQIEHVRTMWLYDSYDAVDSVFRVLSMSTLLHTDVKSYSLYCQLGQDCLKYFNDRASPTTASLGNHHLVPITEVNLSENQLLSVPPELFQMHSLQVLKLTYNRLVELPSSDNPLDPVYTASQIKYLDLDWNQLKVLPEDLFRGFAPSLEELSVNQNKLHDLPPGIWVMPKLKRLQLGHNRLSRMHHFSSPRYFDDSEITRKVISMFTISEGTLQRSDPSKEEDDICNSLEKYIKRLAKFVQLLHSVRCVSGVQCVNVLQEVIDTHWLRYRQMGLPAVADGAENTNEAESLVTAQEEIEILTPEDDEEEEEEEIIPSFSKLTFLDLSHNDFSEVPWDLPCIVPNLQRLDLRGNRITDLDIVRSMPAAISTLMLDENQIVNLLKLRPVSLPCGNPILLLSIQPSKSSNLYCNHCKHGHLENLSNLTLGKNRLEKFPIVDVIEQCIPEDPDLLDSTFDNISYQPLFPNLSILSLEHNRLRSVPQYLHHLTHLSSLTLSHNAIHELPLEMGLMNTQALLVLKVDGLYLKNVPPNLLAKPVPKYLLSYLKSMLQK